jgi:hypothetical protein
MSGFVAGSLFAIVLVRAFYGVEYWQSSPSYTWNRMLEYLESKNSLGS